MKVSKIAFLQIFFGLTTVVLADSGKVERPSIKLAMVHSYHNGFEWTDSVDDGFVSKLSENYKVEIVRRYYLDAKREPGRISQVGSETLNDLSVRKFDLLFVTDDDAMKQIGLKYLGSSKPMVFAGINRSLSEYGIGQVGEPDVNRLLPKNTAGVLEFYPLIPLLELIRKIQPKVKVLNAFFDESETGKAVLSRFNFEIQEPAVNKLGFVVGTKVVSNDREKWESALVRSDPTTDVNLIFPFSNVRDSKSSSKPNAKALSPNEFAARITALTKTPEYATASLTMSFPFFATVGIRGKEHGEDAAEQAHLLLSGKSDHHVTIGKYARLNFNTERAKNLQVNLPIEILAYSYSLRKQGSRQ